MDNPLFDSQTRKRLRDRAALLTSARKELNRITSASLTTLKSNFKTPEELEETIKKLEKQLTSTAPNKTRLTGARKRVTNMRTRVTGGGGFRRAGLIAMAATKKNNNGLESHPLKKREKTPAVNVNLGSFFESAEAEQNKKNERKKYEKMIRNGEPISKSNRNKIELLYNNLAKELNKRNASNKAAANKAALLAARRKANANTLEKRRIAVELASEQEKSANRASREERNKAVKNAKTAANKEAAEMAKKIAAGAIASIVNKEKRTELEKVLTRLEKLNTPRAMNLYNTISNNNKQILNKNENLSNRYKKIKKEITNARINTTKTAGNMVAFAQEFQKKPSIFNRGKAFLAARAKNAAARPPPLSKPSILNRGKAFLAARAATKPPPPSFNEAAARNALRKYLNASVKPTYNKALMNAILKLPNLNNNTRRRLQSPRMYALQRGAGAFRNRAVTVGDALGRGAGAFRNRASTVGDALGRGAGAFRNRASTVGGALGRGAVAAGGNAIKYITRTQIDRLKNIVSNPKTTRGNRYDAITKLKEIKESSNITSNNRAIIQTFLNSRQNLNLNRGTKPRSLKNSFLGLFSRKPVMGQTGPSGAAGTGRTPPASKNLPNFIPLKNWTNWLGRRKPIPLGYVLRTEYNNNNVNKKNPRTGYYKDPEALQSQLNRSGHGPKPRPSGYYGARRNNYGYGRYYGYGSRRNYGYGSNVGGSRGPSGGIVFAPKINVGAARIGAQTFGGTRVGGQTMGGSRATTGNVSGSRATTGNAGGSRVTNGNAGTGRLAVSAPTTNGNRQLAATSEQLIRGAGGAEAVEKGIKALNAANGNVARAKATSKLPNNTFTNIYAMGGPVAAKRIVESRRRRRTVGGRRVASKKKRVTHKPKKQYIKLTPYQFKRLTDHIKKNNLRKVLIKEITH
jgi:hypothetical protein